MSIKPITTLMLCGMSMLAATGCEPAEPSAGVAEAPVTNPTAGPAAAPAEEVADKAAGDPYDDLAEDDGFIVYYEPYGDESELRYKLEPTRPMPGEEVRVTVRTGSVYGPIPSQAKLRIGDPADPVAQRSPDDAGWTDMPGRRMFVEDYDEATDTVTEREVDSPPNSEGYGYDEHVAMITLPAADGSIELLTVTDDHRGGEDRIGFVLYPFDVDAE